MKTMLLGVSAPATFNAHTLHLAMNLIERLQNKSNKDLIRSGPLVVGKRAGRSTAAIISACEETSEDFKWDQFTREEAINKNPSIQSIWMLLTLVKIAKCLLLRLQSSCGSDLLYACNGTRRSRCVLDGFPVFP
jgi:hypothetical protein